MLVHRLVNYQYLTVNACKLLNWLFQIFKMFKNTNKNVFISIFKHQIFRIMFIVIKARSFISVVMGKNTIAKQKKKIIHADKPDGTAYITCAYVIQINYRIIEDRLQNHRDAVAAMAAVDSRKKYVPKRHVQNGSCD